MQAHNVPGSRVSHHHCGRLDSMQRLVLAREYSRVHSSSAYLLEEDDLVASEPEEGVLFEVRLGRRVGAAAGHQVQPQRVPAGCVKPHSNRLPAMQSTFQLMLAVCGQP
jgi:hypothetical protein